MALSEHAMPLIVVNMGAEMVYVLNQRLLAQKVEKVKRKKGTSRVFSGSNVSEAKTK